VQKALKNLSGVENKIKIETNMKKPPLRAFVFGNQLNRFQSFGQLMESKAT
jgi:hypothetical protein